MISATQMTELLAEVCRLWTRLKDEGTITPGTISCDEWTHRLSQCHSADEAKTVLRRMKSGEFQRYAPTWENFASHLRDLRRSVAQEAAEQVGDDDRGGHIAGMAARMKLPDGMAPVSVLVAQFRWQLHRCRISGVDNEPRHPAITEMYMRVMFDDMRRTLRADCKTLGPDDIEGAMRKVFRGDYDRLAATCGVA